MTTTDYRTYGARSHPLSFRSICDCICCKLGCITYRQQETLLLQKDRATHLSVEILQVQNIPIVWNYLRDPAFSRFYTILECDKHTRTERRTDRYTTTACITLAQRRAVKIDHIALPTKYNYQATSVDSLSICYTSKFATDTVTKRTDGVYALACVASSAVGVITKVRRARIC